jgi:hypothetical protein
MLAQEPQMDTFRFGRRLSLPSTIAIKHQLRMLMADDRAKRAEEEARAQLIDIPQMKVANRAGKPHLDPRHWIKPAIDADIMVVSALTEAFYGFSRPSHIYFLRAPLNPQQMSGT